MTIPEHRYEVHNRWSDEDQMPRFYETQSAKLR